MQGDLHDLCLDQVEGTGHVLGTLHVIAEAAAGVPVAGVLDGHATIEIALGAKLVVQEGGVATAELTVA
jgi:hypothetical protein